MLMHENGKNVVSKDAKISKTKNRFFDVLIFNKILYCILIVMNYSITFRGRPQRSGSMLDCWSTGHSILYQGHDSLQNSCQ